MGPRVRRIGGEAAKFSAVNVVATIVAVVLFNVLVHGITGISRPGPLNGWPVTSWFLANCVGMGSASTAVGDTRSSIGNPRVPAQEPSSTPG